MNENYTFYEIKKECGEFEKKLMQDEIFINILNAKWGNKKNDK